MESEKPRIRVQGERIYIESRTIEEMEQVYQNESDAEMKQAYFEMCTEMKKIVGREEWACDWNIRLNSGETIGGIGYKGIPDSNGYVEVGYGIDEPYRRHGYATEAVKYMLQWALSQEDVVCVQAQTEPDNEISQKVLIRNGFVRNGDGVEGPLFEVHK